ncbi:hypothetical protein C7B61_00330 [filamentous cyanobacterium CCP1]|nr:hypothetical protein C7B76_16730 [filamentous cyanobacterium CCP2]PSB68543.1 hypothetical protein C7B61_00330 [filamentous cyanobacterium CCP1]
MSNAEKTSLHSFAKSIGASKTTVHRKAKELGIDTSNGLTESDRARILEVLKPATGNTPNGSIVPSNGAIVPSRESRLGSVIDAYSLPELNVMPTYKHVGTDEFVSEQLGKLDEFVDGSTQQGENLTQELIQQAIARGAKTGTILVQVEIAAIERVRSQGLENYGKKQGLEVP